MKISRRKLIWLLLLLAVAGGSAGYYWGVYLPRERARRAEEAKKLATDGGDMDRTYKVRRDDLVIGLLQGGYVNASKKHKLSLQANYRTKLLWVIDENSKVKAGDLLAKFETDELKEQIENQEIELDNLSKELEIAIEAEKILLSSNAAELQSAEETLLQADDALRKYRRFERASQRDSLDLAISKAEASLEAANSTYTEIRDSDTATKSNPSKITRLVNALEQAKLNLRKVKISTESKLVQQKKSIANLRRRIRRLTDQLNRYKSYMEMMKLVAPVDGIVIYADPDRRWGNLDVKPGIDIGKGQVLITIPEMSNLVVDFDLPEQYRSKIKIGDRAVISPDSLPGEKFGGTISHIDTLPVNLVVWDSSSPKIYKSKIKLDKQSPRLVNGMSVQINVVTRVIPNTIFVPVEAVFEENDRFFVYRSGLGGPTEVDVSIGESNDNFVQITKGLEEGDVVYLYRPYQKTQEAQ